MPTLLALQVADESAAAYFTGGVLRCAVRESLLTRRPPASGFPCAAVDSVLLAAGVEARSVDRVVVVGVAESQALAWLRRGVRRLRGDVVAGGVRVRPPPAGGGPVAVGALRIALEAAGLGSAKLEIMDVNSLRRPKGPEEGPAALAVWAALAFDSSMVLPDSPLWGPGFTDMEAYRALSNARLPRDRVEDPVAAARAALAAGQSVVWARGPAAFLDDPLGPRMVLRPGARPSNPRYVGPELDAVASLLVAPDGLPALTPVDVVRSWRENQGARLVLGDYLV